MSRAGELSPEVRKEYPYGGFHFDQPATEGASEPATMHYLDEGIGPVVLMLHGNPTWSFYYRKVVDRLVASGFRCIVPDHIGCGLSDKPRNYAYTLKRRIDDVERLIDSLEIRKFSLIVHDWGGAIGCGLAIRRPDALQKLVLLNTAAYLSKRIPWRIALVKIPYIGELIIRGLNGFAGPATVMSVNAPLSPSARLGMLWPYRSWRDRVAVWNFVRDIPLSKSHPSYRTLAEIQESLVELKSKPVRIIWGGKDFCFTKHFYKRWLKIFPDADADYIEGCGHYVLEDSSDYTLEKIEIFLKS
ncbi:MAG: alpha/beta fold hydrolase [Verrucomicrobiota bacterium]